MTKEENRINYILIFIVIVYCAIAILYGMGILTNE
jgi:hypothetical protein